MCVRLAHQVAAENQRADEFPRHARLARDGIGEFGDPSEIMQDAPATTRSRLSGGSSSAYCNRKRSASTRHLCVTLSVCSSQPPANG